MYNYFLYLEIYKFNFFFKIITKFINGIFNWKNWRKKQANARFKMPQCTIIAISNQFSSQHRSIQSQIKRSVQQQQQKQQLRILFSTDIWENSSWDYSARSSWFLWLKPYLSCEVQTPCVRDEALESGVMSTPLPPSLLNWHGVWLMCQVSPLHPLWQLQEWTHDPFLPNKPREVCRSETEWRSQAYQRDTGRGSLFSL